MDTLVQPLLSASPTVAAIVADLIAGIQNIIIGVNNPPKENKDIILNRYFNKNESTFWLFHYQKILLSTSLADACSADIVLPLPE